MRLLENEIPNILPALYNNELDQNSDITNLHFLGQMKQQELDMMKQCEL
ncbi:2209_t:CDS:2 [Entrophospora sp. SA101]|nr:2209_t:CDS:2 [Entrophospora sp. SA101]